MRGLPSDTRPRQDRIKIAVHQQAASLIDLLDELERAEFPTPDQLATEKGRLEIARKGGRRDLVDELKAALHGR